MKVKFKNLLLGYTGKADDSVIYYSPKYNQYIIRRAPAVKLGDNHRHFAGIGKQIFGLQPSAAYKEDIRDYLVKYNALPACRDRQIRSWNCLYAKLMWTMHHIYQTDLTSITRDDIPTLPCRTIAAAVEAGLLPKVKGYEAYQAEM